MSSSRFCRRCKERWKARTKAAGRILYALRGYIPNDSARHVHWKASARFGSLMVREFTHEDDCRVLLVLDPHISAGAAGAGDADLRFRQYVRTLRTCRNTVRGNRLAFLRAQCRTAIP